MMLEEHDHPLAHNYTHNPFLSYTHFKGDVGMTQRVVRITVDARADKSGGINQDSGRTTIKNSQLGVSWLLPGWQPTSEE